MNKQDINNIDRVSLNALVTFAAGQDPSVTIKTKVIIG